MTPMIEAILFDMGGTLRGSVQTDEATRVATVGQIAALLGANTPAQELTELLSTRAQAYSRWARETLVELNEVDLWTQWMLPDWPRQQVETLAVELNQLWRAAIGVREIFPETKPVLLELFRRGYRLGLVSNTTSSIETPRALEKLQLSGVFETVLLSCVVGMRKPDPAFLLAGARRMGVPPERCAYVGDRLNRDVEAARKAGFAQVILLRDQDFDAHQKQHPQWRADVYIDRLDELLEFFPAPSKPHSPHPVYRASLSTMWARRNFPGLTEFFEAARRLGFSHIELNHQIDTAMLATANLNGTKFSSVHEPCPADVSTDLLKERDWLISSPDEERRRLGVESIRHSIDLAARLGAPVIVVHSGMVSTDLSTEKELRALFEAGKTGTEAYRQARRKMDEIRAGLIGERLQAVKKSLGELLAYARPHRIRLGLENRYHYFDIPTPDEMEELLALGAPDELGFILDVGHAQALDRLGFFPFEEWLRRFSSRLIEVHLHDVRGVTDHLAPGLGEVDYARLAAYLPVDAIRTFELQPTNTPEQVRDSLKRLAALGLVAEEHGPKEHIDEFPN